MLHTERSQKLTTVETSSLSEKANGFMGSLVKVYNATKYHCCVIETYYQPKKRFLYLSTIAFFSQSRVGHAKEEKSQMKFEEFGARGENYKCQECSYGTGRFCTC